MKRLRRFPFLSLMTIFLSLAIARPAAADCQETSPDVWNCTGTDSDGLDATTNGPTDTITIDLGALVTEAASVFTTINLINGTLGNAGSVQFSTVAGTAVFASGTANLTNNGLAEASADSGTAMVSDSGDVANNLTVNANGASGTGVFAATGDVDNTAAISATGDFGTGILTGGGANDVTNSGTIIATGQDGIAIVTGAGNDTVALGASSTTSGGLATASSLCTDGITIAVCTGDDDDFVTIHSGASVTGVVDGGPDTDTLRLPFLTQSQIALLSPASDSVTHMGNTYTWINFEQLVGMPEISITDVTQNESNAGTTFTFNVTLSFATPEIVTVDAATANDTAFSGSDYVTVPTTTITFPANTTGPQTVVVTVNGDTAFEPNETFFVNLTNAANASILDGQGLGTIVNDDARSTALSITKTAPAAAQAGVPFDYTITVTNGGPDDSTGATVTDILPANLTLVSATPSQGSCSGTTTIVCTLGPILNGATATITLTVSATSAGPTTNTATVAPADNDPNAGDNSSSATFTIGAATAIPTLSEWMLLALALSLIAIAVMRSQG